MKIDTLDQHFLEAATQIAYQLINEAIWHKDRCTWLGYKINPADGYSQELVYGTIGPDFYEGTSGVALFLAHTYQLTGIELFKTHSIGAVKQALSQITKAKFGESFFLGLGGVAKSAYDAGVLTDSAALKNSGIDLVKTILSTDIKDFGIDIINGPAGILPFLIQLERRENVSGLKDTIIKMGEIILHNAHAEQQGISWDTRMPKAKNLTGYAHGASGFVHALTELYVYLKDDRYAVAAAAGMAYEHSCFVPAQSNWPDYRMQEGQPAGEEYCMNAWCHGAAGIGLSRVRAYEVFKDESTKADLIHALYAVCRDLSDDVTGEPHSFGLCHGAAGNAELLIEAAIVLNEPEYFKQAAMLGNFGISKYLEQYLPFPSGLKNGVYSPCFMNGLAGIGYFYLRLATQGQLPSLLIQRG